jgi:hypothetical protein
MRMPGPNLSLSPFEAARLLFGNDTHRLYQRWQREIAEPLLHGKVSSSEKSWLQAIKARKLISIGHFPCRFVYMQFSKYLLITGHTFPISEQSPGSKSSNTASKCGHALHPSKPPGLCNNCPVCNVKQCIQALQRIWGVWLALGGPLRVELADDGSDIIPDDKEQHHSWEMLCHKVKHVWRYEKVRWAQMVDLYNDFAAKEREWEESHYSLTDKEAEVVKHAMSAQLAVDIAWRECPGIQPAVNESHKVPSQLEPVEKPLHPPLFPLRSSTNLLRSTSLRCVPSPAPPTDPKDKESLASDSSELLSPPPVNKKAVTFTDDTMDFKSRKLCTFQRSHWNFRPGKYASPSPRHWADTSFVVDNDDTELDSVSVSVSDPDVAEESKEESKEYSKEYSKKEPEEEPEEDDFMQPIKHTPKHVLLPPTRVLNDSPGFSFKSQSQLSEEESVEESDNKNDIATTNKFDANKESGHKSFLPCLRRRTREEFEDDMVSSDGLLARPSKRNRVRSREVESNKGYWRGAGREGGSKV